MRLMFLAMLIVLGFCLAYARNTQPVAPQATSYDGPATFVSFHPDNEEDIPAHWLLVCRVSGETVVFPVRDGSACQAAGTMHAGQGVTLHYDLPVTSAPGGGTELGPPTLRGIELVNTGDGGVLALNSPAH